MQTVSTCLWFDDQALDAAMITMTKLDIAAMRRAYDNA
jgi:predicted 3-demethylubiquinone-9 3-methyltransferase (glyoxalase superfamily)